MLRFKGHDSGVEHNEDADARLEPQTSDIEDTHLGTSHEEVL